MTVLRFSSFSRFWACRQHDEDLVHVGASLCCLSLQSSSLPPIATFAALSMHVRRANYRAAIWRRTVFSLRALFLAHMAMAGSASLNHPVTHSSDEILWMTRPAAQQASSFVGPDHMRLHIGLLHTALYVDAAKDILTGVKLVTAQAARISHTSQHPSSLHMKTKSLMMMNIDLMLHCVVLLQLECWKESAHHSCMLDQYMFYNIQPYIIVFSLTIDLLGRETPCKRHKLVLSLTVTALLRVYH